MLSFSDISLLVLFCAVVLIYEMISRGVINIENLQAIFSGNLFLYLIFAGVIIYFRKQQTGRNNDLERSILALNNELHRMRTENDWRNDAVSQGMIELVFGGDFSRLICKLYLYSRFK